MKHFLTIFILTVIVQWSCLKAPEYPIEPIINFVGLTSEVMKQGAFNSDSTIITFSFTDGDGDLGDNDSVNIFLTDERIDTITTSFKIPLLSQSAGAKGISGEIAIKVYTTCCLFPNGQTPCTPSSQYPVDSLVYGIYIIHRGQHMSNIIYTPAIKLLCQ